MPDSNSSTLGEVIAIPNWVELAKTMNGGDTPQLIELVLAPNDYYDIPLGHAITIEYRGADGNLYTASIDVSNDFVLDMLKCAKLTTLSLAFSEVIFSNKGAEYYKDSRWQDFLLYKLDRLESWWTEFYFQLSSIARNILTGEAR